MFNATTMPSSAYLYDSHADTATVQYAVKTDRGICIEFYEHTCGCQKADGMPCSSLFPLEHFIDMPGTRSGIIMTTIHDHNATIARGRHKPGKEARSHHILCTMGSMYVSIHLPFYLELGPTTEVRPLRNTT